MRQVISAATWSQHTRAAMVLFVEVTPGFEEADAAWAPLSSSPITLPEGLGGGWAQIGFPAPDGNPCV
jgi:hypothetical protein